MRSVAATEALAAIERGAQLVDVRSPSAFAREALAGSLNVPLEDVRAGRLPNTLSLGTPVIVVCEHGQISELAGLYLEGQGFEDVANVLGGLRALRATPPT